LNKKIFNHYQLPLPLSIFTKAYAYKLMRITLSSVSMLFALLFSCATQGQTIVFEDSDHVIYYELVGDSVIVTVEDLNDFTLDLSNDSDPGKVDYITFMFDINQTGTIDGGIGTDVYYQNDNTLVNNVCKGDILSSNLLSSCGSLPTNATLSAGLESTFTSNNAHLVYQISIPKSELYTDSQVCGRMSVRVNKAAGVSLNVPTNLPTSTESFFVDVYFPIILFETIDLGDDILYCTSDSILANDTYPSYLWSDNTTSNFIQPKDSGDVYLTVKDNTCALSDTVNVIIQDENYCSNINLRFPNIVTPNNDGMNDFFEPLASAAQTTMSYTDAELSIYSRWGVKVSQRNGQAPVWDCYLDWGQKVPSGTYYYVFNPGGSGSETINGFFTVLYTEK
jgi:gliding motility-associated-like protein